MVPISRGGRMSILVKGIDMPQSCGECHFLTYSFNVPVCSITKQILTYQLDETLEQALNKRMNECPLVEVSKRNTDREKFQRLVLNVAKEHAEKGEDIETLGSLCADLIIGVHGLIE